MKAYVLYSGTLIQPCLKTCFKSFQFDDPTNFYLPLSKPLHSKRVLIGLKFPIFFRFYINIHK